MSNPFKQNKDFEGKPKRNTFDLSYRNHFTANFGQLLPVFCKPVLPGDHFRIKANFGLRFMPTAFPLMNKIRAHVHFFYVRNRNLWKDFPDFIYNNKENLDPPYMPNDKTNPIYLTGGLADYLGVPTTVSAVDYSSKVVPFSDVSDQSDFALNYNTASFPAEYDKSPAFFAFLEPSFETLSISQDDYTFKVNSSSSTESTISFPTLNVDWEGKHISSPIAGGSTVFSNPALSDGFCSCMKFVPRNGRNVSRSYGFNLNFGNLPINESFVVEAYVPTSECVLYRGVPSLVHYAFGSTPLTVDSFNSLNGPIPSTVADVSLVSNSEGVECYQFKFVIEFRPGMQKQNVAIVLNLPFVSSRDVYQNITFKVRSATSNRDYSGRYNVYGSDGNQVPISALPFRAYESIYNAFYRDSRNNPFVVNGQVEYNKYLPTTDGGLDTNRYAIRFRNWELDQFTSCVQSPQQGVAPLVGISSLGKVTFQGEDGVTRTYTTETADDADTITKVNVNSGEKPDSSTARAIVDLVSSGISINDFRNVNAFQRWKETNIRRGMKLRDQTLARWGVDISYNTLDMPEFIGGISTDVDVNAVFQTVETPEVPLGSFAGAASAFGGTNNDVSQYCDEHGFIIGILSIVPTPVYDCILPKWLTKQNCLDYFNPEFDHIGMQPVKYSELCPITAVAVANNDDSEDTMQRTFGYQRPWYEYIYSNDEIHGLFRTQLRNFVLSRSFSGLPELNSSFTTIQPGSLNNVFTTDVGDKIIGSITFDVTAKRPISAISIPSL